MTGPITSLTPAPLSTVTAQTPLSAGFPSPPSFDVIELLPEHAQNRLRQLRLRATEAHRLVPEFEQMREASMARVEAENQLKQLQAHPQEFGRGLPEAHPLVVTAEKHLDKMTADLKRLQERSEMRAQAWQAASAALSACETWLRDGRPHGTVLEDYDGPEPKLLKGENGLLDAIENRRRRVRELRSDLNRLASAPYPSSYAKQQMRAQIEALAMQGAPSVSRLVELDGPVEFQTQRLTSEVHAERRLLAFSETADAVALIAWLHRDLLIKRLDAEIDVECDGDAGALSHEAREKAEAEVMGDLLAVEREEAAFVFAAWENGLACEHRSDCSPLALLGLRLVTTQRASEMPETSAGYSWPWRR